MQLGWHGHVLACRPFPAGATVTLGEAADADLVLPGVGERVVLIRDGQVQAPAGLEPLDPEADPGATWVGRVARHPEIQVSVRRERWPAVDARRLRARVPPVTDMTVGAIAAVLVAMGTAGVTLSSNVVPEPSPWMSPNGQLDMTPVVLAMYAPEDEDEEAPVEGVSPWTPEARDEVVAGPRPADEGQPSPFVDGPLAAGDGGAGDPGAVSYMWQPGPKGIGGWGNAAGAPAGTWERQRERPPRVPGQPWVLDGPLPRRFQKGTSVSGGGPPPERDVRSPFAIPPSYGKRLPKVRLGEPKVRGEESDATPGRAGDAPSRGRGRHATALCVRRPPVRDLRTLDVVFVVDVSTTMGGTVAEVHRQIGRLGRFGDAAGVDVNYGLVTFVDDVDLARTPDGSPAFGSARAVARALAAADERAAVNLQLHHDAENTDWPENSLDALVRAAHGYPWRIGLGSRRLIVWMTDDTFGRKGQTLSRVVRVEHGYDEVADELEAHDVQVVAFASWLGGPARDEDVGAGILSELDGRPAIPVASGGFAMPLQDLAEDDTTLSRALSVAAFGGTLCARGSNEPSAP